MTRRRPLTRSALAGLGGILLTTAVAAVVVPPSRWTTFIAGALLALLVAALLGSRGQQQASAPADAANPTSIEPMSAMSHELRTSLNAVIGFAQLMEVEELTDRQRESVTHILNGGRRVLTLIEKVLDPSRVEGDGVMSSPEGEQAGETNRCILYIADNAANLGAVEKILEPRRDIELVVAMQERLGVDLANQHSPTLILVDLKLPDADGDVVLRQLRENPTTSSTPVVVLSAGAKSYVTKPLDVGMLARTIEHLLNGAR